MNSDQGRGVAVLASGQKRTRCLASVSTSMRCKVDVPGTIRLSAASVACDAPVMSSDAVQPPFDQFLATADAVAQARPEVDLDMAREVFLEAATLLHNGLALDGLDEHDADAVVAGLCADLITADPGDAVRRRARAASDDPGELHDPEGVAAAYLDSARILQL